MPSVQEQTRDQLASMRLISMKRVLQIVPASRPSIYRWINEGHFPKPVKLGKSLIGFRESEVLTWLNGRERALGGGPAFEVHTPQAQV